MWDMLPNISRQELFYMKKFIFGLIILVCIVSLAFCLAGGKESESVEPQSKNCLVN